MAGEESQTSEQREARMPNHTPPAPSESEFQEVSGENSAAPECPFLVRGSGELAAESERAFELEETSEARDEMEKTMHEFESLVQTGMPVGPESHESWADQAPGKARRADSFAFDPYAAIRPALSREHANLSASEITVVLGGMPAAVALQQVLNSPAIRQASLATLLGKAARRSVRVNGSDVSIPAYLRLVAQLCREAAERHEAEGEDLRTIGRVGLGFPGNEAEVPDHFAGPLEESEFRVDHLPPRAQAQFSKTDSAAWRDAVAAAIGAGVKTPKDLADLIFFMQHRERIVGGVGKPIEAGESDFFKLRAAWDLYETIATRRLSPAAACSVFLAANLSSDYEQYVNKPTTGWITLMVNGRSSGKVQIEAFESMRRTVESLGAGDSLFIANWQFSPAATPLTTGSPSATWADLLKRKAIEGVKIRALISDLPPFAPQFQTDLTPLNDLIRGLPSSATDNFQYVFSPHPAHAIASHHQKLLVARTHDTVVAFCGGLDISFSRIPTPTSDFVWHDVHAKLEGLIARDIEREFVLRWNREKGKSTGTNFWKDFEILAPAAIASADKAPEKNKHKLQTLRTVSVGARTANVRRDDVWQGYFRLIGCATRFLFLENQYFHEPALADAIVKQTQAQPNLIVILVVSTRTDDPDTAPTRNMHALRFEFFSRLCRGIPANRLRMYTMLKSLVHSKLILVDDRALSMGSANANPRDFFMDTQLNVMLDDAAVVKHFRHHLWAHDLGVTESEIAGWAVPDFFARWDAVARANQALITTPLRMVGEGIICFDHTKDRGTSVPLMDILSEL